MYQIESVSQLPILLLQTPNMNLVNKANPNLSELSPMTLKPH